VIILNLNQILIIILGSFILVRVQINYLVIVLTVIKLLVCKVEMFTDFSLLFILRLKSEMLVLKSNCPRLNNLKLYMNLKEKRVKLIYVVIILILLCRQRGASYFRHSCRLKSQGEFFFFVIFLIMDTPFKHPYTNNYFKPRKLNK